MNKPKLLFNLPVELFNYYLYRNDVKKEDVKTFLYSHSRAHKNVRCEYLELPEGSPDGRPILVLMDFRPIGVEEVVLCVVSDMPFHSGEDLTEPLNEYARITVRSIGQRGNVPANDKRVTVHDLMLQASPMERMNEITFGKETRYAVKYFLELTLKAEAMYWDKGHPWITSYHLDDSGVVPVSIKQELIKEKEAVPA